MAKFDEAIYNQPGAEGASTGLGVGHGGMAPMPAGSAGQSQMGMGGDRGVVVSILFILLTYFNTGFANSLSSPTRPIIWWR